MPPLATPQRSPRPVSRRQFMQAAGVLAAGGALAACAGAEQRTLFEAEARGTVTPQVVLPSPIAPGSEATASPELARFLALSAALTGIADLDPRLGQVYWNSLQGTGQQSAVADLFEQIGLSAAGGDASLDSLQAAGLFDDPDARRLVGEITKLWFTGVYIQGEEPAVATFTDALAWKLLRFTKPATICGSFGFWAIRPLVDVSRSAEPVAPALPAGEA